jgi:hypothetical protein
VLHAVAQGFPGIKPGVFFRGEEMIGYSARSMFGGRDELFGSLKEAKEWIATADKPELWTIETTEYECPAQDANAEEDLLDTTLSLPGIEPAASQIPCALQRVEASLKRMEDNQVKLEAILMRIIETLAEEEDPDAPGTYLDGSRV